ncbi:DUF6479 family protein [Streptomyces sp. NRRL F-4489]|uniref:DUF6479 family protein n=1 Tax=Streptomyces sp. NRRL F-4489 TaxID=1609095 RepID=UPI00082B222F|nr:DUF6479 family protein [Streptomyces sp. NRRL F-4489]
METVTAGMTTLGMGMKTWGVGMKSFGAGMAAHPSTHLAAAHGTSGALFTIVGVVVVALLIAAFVWGRRVRQREPGPPHPESHPRLPHGEPVGDVLERREPDELPRSTHRRKPYELKGDGIESRRSEGPGPGGGPASGEGPATGDRRT